MTNDSISALLSDSTLAEKLSTVLQAQKKQADTAGSIQNVKLDKYGKYIEIIQALTPFIPEKNRQRAEILLRLFEFAGILQSMQASD